MITREEYMDLHRRYLDQVTEVSELKTRIVELEVVEKVFGLPPLDRYRIAAVQGMTAAGIYKTEDIARHAMYIARECLAIIEAEDNGAE